MIIVESGTVKSMRSWLLTESGRRRMLKEKKNFTFQQRENCSSRESTKLIWNRALAKVSLSQRQLQHHKELGEFKWFKAVCVPISSPVVFGDKILIKRKLICMSIYVVLSILTKFLQPAISVV